MAALAWKSPNFQIKSDGSNRPIRDYSQDSRKTANEVKMLMTEN
jgi:hypothetical protein